MDDAFPVSRVVVYPNGLVTWLPTNVFYSICNVDITYYPYDEHTCHFPIFSSTDDDSTIKFVPMASVANIQNYNEHGEWELTSTRTEVAKMHDPTINVWASTFVPSITIGRRPGFAILHTYFPLLLLFLMNILTFLVPLDKGERVSFSITLLLALIFFTASTSSTFPKSSLKMSYFSCTMTLAICASALGVMLSVILVCLQQESVRPMPFLFLLLATSYKGKKRMCGFCHGDNTVVQLKQENHAQTEKNKPDVSRNCVKVGTRSPKDHVLQVMPTRPGMVTGNEGRSIEDETEQVSWSEAAEALNMVIFWVYTVVVVLSVTVLIALHQHQ